MAAPAAVTPKIYTALVLDFETGGLDCSKAACTQIAVQSVRLDTWEVLERYASYIAPYNRQEAGTSRRKVLRSRREIEQEEVGVPMDYEPVALEYSGITMEILRSRGVSLKEVAAAVIAVAQRAALSKGAQCKPILIGQNITFDIGFLQQMMTYAGMQKEFAQVFAGTTDFHGSFCPHYIDTIDLGRLALAHNPSVTSYKLELLCGHLGIELDDAHDADADVTATLSVAAVCSGRLRNGNGNGTDLLPQKEKTRDHFKI